MVQTPHNDFCSACCRYLGRERRGGKEAAENRENSVGGENVQRKKMAAALSGALNSAVHPGRGPPGSGQEAPSNLIPGTRYIY